jgi:iron(III) transport system substrate-binding protein
VSRARWVPLSILIVSLLGVGLVRAAPTPSTLVVYSAVDEPILDVLKRAFEPMTNIRVEAFVLQAAGTMAARIRAEAARPRADVFIGGSVEIHESLARDGLLLSYRSPMETTGRIPPAFIDPRGLWHGIYSGPVAIIVNRRLYDQEVRASGAPFPRTWDDLLHTGYARRLVVWSPATVGGGYIFLVAQIGRQRGEDPGFAWMRRLDANVRVYAPTGAAPIPFVVRGEAVAGIAWLDQAVEARDAGQPLEVVLPAEAIGEIGAISIIKGGSNPDAARRFVDLVYTQGMQEFIAKFGLYPVRTDVSFRPDFPELSSLRFVTYDRLWAGQHRDRLIKKWDDLIGSQRR